MAASLHELRQVKGNFLENLKDNNVTKLRKVHLSFTSKVPAYPLRTQWVTELLTHRQRVLDFRGAPATVGLVVWMFKRWHLLSKLPVETRKINQEKIRNAYKNWKDADFAPYCDKPSCARNCPVSNRNSQHPGAAHLRFPRFTNFSSCIQLKDEDKKSKTCQTLDFTATLPTNCEGVSCKETCKLDKASTLHEFVQAFNSQYTEVAGGKSLHLRNIFLCTLLSHNTFSVSHRSTLVNVGLDFLAATAAPESENYNLHGWAVYSDLLVLGDK